jgi:Flp pilus assembly protein TadG
MSDDREEGSILILAIGFLVIAMLLVWAVLDASAVFLDRRDLADAADGAALDAAQEVDLDAIYAHGVGVDLPLDPTAVDRELAAWVDANYGDAGWTFRGWVSGPHTVTVTATRVVKLPVYGSVTLTATSSATDATTG